MTTTELDRTKVIEQVLERRLTAVVAAQQLGLMCFLMDLEPQLAQKVL